jgi:hypothetical protein
VDAGCLPAGEGLESGEAARACALERGQEAMLCHEVETYANECTGHRHFARDVMNERFDNEIGRQTVVVVVSLASAMATVVTAIVTFGPHDRNVPMLFPPLWGLALLGFLLVVAFFAKRKCRYPHVAAPLVFWGAAVILLAYVCVLLLGLFLVASVKY